MKRAILCPGPSLPRFWAETNREMYGEVIAVNTAGHRYPCDWLAFADWHIVRSPDLIPPRKGYLCKRGMWPETGAWFDLSTCFPLADLPSPPRCGFTFANALAWAQAHSKGDAIDVYGFDCARVAVDFAGQTGDHSEARWGKELPWIRAAWGENVTVHSDLPEETRQYLTAGDIGIDASRGL